MLNFLFLIIIVVVINRFLKNQASVSSYNNNSLNSTDSNSNNMVQVIQTEDEFKSVIQQSNLVIVDFFAVWCGPCKMIAPMLEKFSQQYTNAKFYKVDVDQLPSVAATNEVTSMPTLLFFKSGELVGKVIGANPAAIKQTLDKLA